MARLHQQFDMAEFDQMKKWLRRFHTIFDPDAPIPRSPFQ